MKSAHEPLPKYKSRKTENKTSGNTPGKSKEVTRFSRKDKEIPADRGAYEKQSSTQGSE